MSTIDRESGAIKHLITDHNNYVEGVGFVAYTLCGWVYRGLEGAYFKYGAWWENTPNVCPHCLHRLECNPHAHEDRSAITCQGCLDYLADQEAGHPADRAAAESQPGA
jgi:hypothetical protein